MAAALLLSAALMIQGQTLGAMDCELTAVPATLDPDSPFLNITFLVADSGTLEPIADASVTPDSDITGAFEPAQGWTDAGGNAHFMFSCEGSLLTSVSQVSFTAAVQMSGYADLAAGPFAIQVAAAPKSMTVSVSAVPDWLGVDQLSTTVTVHVTDFASSSPISGAAVSLANNAGGAFSPPSGTTDSTGACSAMLTFSTFPNAFSVSVTATVSMTGYTDATSSCSIPCVTSEPEDPEPEPLEGWEHVSTMLAPGYGQTGCVIGDSMYIFSGSNGQSTVSSGLVFDPAEQAWGSTAPMSTPRALASCVAYGGKAYVFSGVSQLQPMIGGHRADSEVYDPATDTWSTIEGPTTPRSGAAAVAIGAKAYVIGGRDETGAYLDEVEVYDFASGEWSEGPALPVPIAYMAGGEVDGSIVIGGGETESTRAVNKTFTLDPAEGRWRTHDFSQVQIGKCTGFAQEGRLFMLGAGQESNLVYSFVPGNRTLFVMDTLDRGLAHPLALGHGGNAYLVGGIIADTGNPTPVVVGAGLEYISMYAPEFGVYVPPRGPVATLMTIAYLAVGLVLDGIAVGIAVRSGKKKRRELGWEREKPIPNLSVNGDSGFTHTPGNEIVSHWKRQMLKSRAARYFHSPSIIKGAKLTGETKHVAAFSDGRRMLERHTTETKEVTLDKKVQLHTSPKPSPPKVIMGERQEFPVSEKHVTCGTCRGEKTTVCPTCKGDKNVDCPTCKGTGLAPCKACKGTGMGECNSCGGTGERVCSSCGGRGYRQQRTSGGSTTYETRHSTGVTTSTTIQHGDNLSTVTCSGCHGTGFVPCMPCKGTGRSGICDTCQGNAVVPCGTCKHTGKVPCGKCSATGKVRCVTCAGHGKVNLVGMEVWTYSVDSCHAIFGPKGAEIKFEDFTRKNALAFHPSETQSRFLDRHSDAQGNVAQAKAAVETFMAKPRDSVVLEDYAVMALPVTGCELEHLGEVFKVWGIGGPADCRVTHCGLPENTGAIKTRKAAPLIAGLLFAIAWVVGILFVI